VDSNLVVKKQKLSRRQVYSNSARVIEARCRVEATIVGLYGRATVHFAALRTIVGSGRRS
jgi:hypothetical protein